MLDSFPLVTVIVPCYNAAAFVTETIHSVIAQTYPYWELLLIDDGSKDAIAEVVKPFLKDERIQFRVQTNQGVSAARNNGVALAQGNFIAFLDSDDLWEPTKLQRQMEVFQNYPNVGVCGTDYVPIDAEGKSGDAVTSGQDYYGQASASLVSCELTLPLSSGIVRKEICTRLASEQGFLFDESIPSLSEDFDFWLRLSALCLFYKIAEPLLLYRVWQGNATSRIWLERQKTVLNKIIPRFCDLCGNTPLIQRQHIEQLKSVLYHERGSHPSMSRLVSTYWFIRSLLCNPRNRDSWGALGHQLLSEAMYRRMVKRLKNEK